jgi:hypothetical protein
MTQEPHEAYMKRRFLEEEIEEQKSRLKDQATGHIHTTINVLEQRYKELTGEEYKSPKIYESPDKGRTVYEREFGSDERKIVEPESVFTQYGKDEHEVFLNQDALRGLLDEQEDYFEDDPYPDLNFDNLLFEDDDHVKHCFQEHTYIEELQNYINSTYQQHYAHDGRLQSTEVIIDRGRGLEFCLGNIDKYSNRYGSKGSPDDYRKDLMKIAHYAIIALYCHDKKYSS